MNNLQPYLQIGEGQLASESTPTQAPTSTTPDTVFQKASKEDIQDYVAALFLSSPHVNLSVEYDDDGNQLVFSVEPSEAVINSPEDISGFTNALDAGIN